MLAAIAIYPAERDAFYRCVIGIMSSSLIPTRSAQGIQEPCISLLRGDIHNVLHLARNTNAVFCRYGLYTSCYQLLLSDDRDIPQLYSVITMAGMGLQIDARRFFEFSFGVFGLINFGESIGVRGQIYQAPPCHADPHDRLYFPVRRVVRARFAVC